MKWIVKRPFKSNGNFYNIGDVITSPDNIKLFKTKCNEGKILPVDDIIKIVNLFKDKFGMDVGSILATPVVEIPPTPAKPIPKEEPPVEPVKPVKPVKTTTAASKK